MTVKAVTNKNSTLKGALAIFKIKNKVKEEVMALRIVINVHRALLHNRKNHGASFIGWKKDFIRR